MDIIKTIIALVTIGIAVYSYMSDDRKKRRKESFQEPVAPRPQKVNTSVTSRPASPLPPPVVSFRPMAHELPEEGARVTSDEFESFPSTSAEENLEMDDLRNAIIWGEILERRF